PKTPPTGSASSTVYIAAGTRADRLLLSRWLKIVVVVAATRVRVSNRFVSACLVCGFRVCITNHGFLLPSRICAVPCRSDDGGRRWRRAEPEAHQPDGGRAHEAGIPEVGVGDTSV
uniref:Uncharacterized protein n=1 Tax=Anopheles dirus TaxID=7168 RepID=A0A182N5T4_9DIPT